MGKEMQTLQYNHDDQFLTDFVSQKPIQLKPRFQKVMIDTSINLVAIFAIALVGFATMQTMMA